ncbi:hypothetical protein KWI08_09010 [Morganella morganii]|uniref:hypothetical protein n=1 Tax=Morganella morganii TaxID=582 RepID=UPI0021D0BE0C|nr:hypothetical protein [Morganella morganii]MCU6274034.1 hypothetical protein [Morganella morganii]
MKIHLFITAIAVLLFCVPVSAIPLKIEDFTSIDLADESFFFTDIRQSRCFAEAYKKNAKLDWNGCYIYTVYQWRNILNSKGYSLRDTMLLEAKTKEYSKSNKELCQMLYSFATTIKTDKGAEQLVKDNIIKKNDIVILRIGLVELGDVFHIY